MCGFAGLYSPFKQNMVTEESVMEMIAPIYRRGPDDFGTWCDPQDGIGLGHRRLSIIDISHAGHQPMRSHDERYHIAFNGEIYNFSELKEDIEKLRIVDWKGHSDTEILLEYIASFGIQETLSKAVGMFAFALWDGQKRTLTLARDRVGEKPLYYFSNKEFLLFGSELSCIEAVAKESLEIDRHALSQLVRQGYICAPSSIYRQVSKVMPGEFITFNSELTKDSKCYWSVAGVLKQPELSFEDDEQAVNELEKLFNQSLSGQMLADVPLGAFLSGGVDSSSVVALMQSKANAPVKTFSIGFKDPRYDEAKYAREVAEHLGTEHHELYIDESDLLNVVNDIPNVFSEPFADSSQLPMFLVSKLAKQHVTVCLSGDGGDELFWGYSRYQQTLNAWKRITGLSEFNKSAIKLLAKCLPIHALNMICDVKSKGSMLGDKVHKALTLLDHKEFMNFYRDFLMSSYRDVGSLVIGEDDGFSQLSISDSECDYDSLNELMSTVDMTTYLPDDILCKVDRCAMGHSLEGRIPLLDHRIIEFALRLPSSYKTRDKAKWLLRQVLFKHVPPALIERPKKGFSVPLDVWLRGPLKEWAESLLSGDKIEKQGFLNTVTLKRLWREHQSGVRNWSAVLWNILMFQQWLESRASD